MSKIQRQVDPRTQLSRGAASVLTHAIESARSGSDPHNSVRRSLRPLCRLARTHGVSVETLIRVLKGVWRALPRQRELLDERSAAILRGVVSQCIDEYYRTDGADLSRLESLDARLVPAESLSFMLGPLS